MPKPDWESDGGFWQSTQCALHIEPNLTANIEPVDFLSCNVISNVRVWFLMWATIWDFQMGRSYGKSFLLKQIQDEPSQTVTQIDENHH